MSVINKMLKDLESRESQTEAINADYQPPEKKSSKIRVILLLIIAVAAIAYAILSNSRHMKDEAPLSIKLKDTVPVAEPKIVKKMQSVELKDIPKTQQTKPVLVFDDGVIQQPVGKKVEQGEIEQSSQIVTVEIPTPDVEARTIVEPVTENPIVENKPRKKPATFSMSGSGQDKRLAELKQNISENLAAGNTTQASSLLATLLKSEPDNINARKKLASLKFSQGNYVQAKLLLIEGVEVFPERTDFRLMLARVYVAQEQPNQAMKAISGFQPKIDTEEFLAYRAGLARQLKQIDLAKTDYLTLTEISPSNGKWWLGLGIIEDQTGNYDAALPAYQKALRSNQLENAVNAFVEQRIQILLEAE
ncbi:lipopolysaccharide assembly protein LapB [Paraglaciecola sp. L3A3]|uniref:tetratricopeptide repeat protein n=1 Tax=Paraglaciecola sp. L3A3 TaxID=2686358 RepID=UPI00131DA10A|nr:tetratricopeptide repeat protein [Paraglaciecola sp. L3A3]